jgi:DNA ligase-1
MTDAMLELQIARFQDLPSAAPRATSSRCVQRQVVEIALDGVQTWSRYPGGLALTFARVLRYRDDNGPAEADTIDTVGAISAPGRGPAALAAG